MMKSKIFFAMIAAFVLFTGCTSTNRMMREPNMLVEMDMDDFILSEQYTATATSTKIIGIDWQRLFNSRTGSVQGGSSVINFASIPVVGNLIIDQTTNYALFELMTEHPGYDVVYYPQVEKTHFRPVGIGLIYKETEVTVTARLAKLKQTE